MVSRWRRRLRQRTSRARATQRVHDPGTMSRRSRLVRLVSQVELAKRANVGLSTLMDFEKQFRDTQPASKRAMQTAREKRGIRFLNGATLGIAYGKPSRNKR